MRVRYVYTLIDRLMLVRLGLIQANLDANIGYSALALDYSTRYNLHQCEDVLPPHDTRTYKQIERNRNRKNIEETIRRRNYQEKKETVWVTNI